MMKLVECPEVDSVPALASVLYIGQTYTGLAGSREANIGSGPYGATRLASGTRNMQGIGSETKPHFGMFV